MERFQTSLAMTMGYNALRLGNVTEARGYVDEMEGIVERQRGGMEDTRWKMMHLYWMLLKSTLVVRSNDLSYFSSGSQDEAESEGDALPRSMSEVLKILETKIDGHDPFDWLRPKELETALLTNFAIVLLLKGHPQRSLEMIKRIKTGRSKDDGGDVASSIGEIGLRYLSLETEARVYIMMGRLTAAQDVLAELIDFVDGQERQTVMLRASLHRLVGCYLQTVGMHKLSVAHFGRGSTGSPFDATSVMASTKIVSQSGVGCGQSSHSFQRSTDDPHDPVKLYVSGLLYQRQGEGCVSRWCLATALEKSKSGSLSRELECRLRLASGKMHLEEGNMAAALEMFERSYGMSKDCQDVTSTLAAIQGLRRLQQCGHHTSMDEQLVLKECQLTAEIEAAVKKALERDIHRTILRWDLASQK